MSEKEIPGPGLDSASAWATPTARSPTQTGYCSGWEIGALWSKAGSWSASTPGPPLGDIEEAKEAEGARPLASRRGRPGSARYAGMIRNPYDHFRSV
jgi:hypothetical protein